MYKEHIGKPYPGHADGNHSPNLQDIENSFKNSQHTPTVQKVQKLSKKEAKPSGRSPGSDPYDRSHDGTVIKVNACASLLCTCIQHLSL